MAERPTFYLDWCLGKAVAEALRVAGAVVEVHGDHFAQDSQDLTWMPRISERGWVILTKDKNIRRSRGEREAVVLASARVFTLSSGNMRGAEMAALFVRHLDAMEQIATALQPPFVAVVGHDGIHIVYPPATPPRPPGEAADSGNDSG